MYDLNFDSSDDLEFERGSAAGKKKQRPKREGIMLAHPVTNRRLSGIMDKVFAQPKLNGERARVHWYHHEPYLISSYGNDIRVVPHILEAFKRMGKELPLDGEMYVHGWTRERIASALRTTTKVNPDSLLLEFHAFDIQQPEEPQWRRIKTLNEIRSSRIFNQSSVKFIDSEIVNKSEYVKIAARYLKDGYEGVILRDPTSLYQFKRDNGILKFKPTEEDEYEIIGFVEGTGWAVGMLGAFIVRGDDGTEFKVGTGSNLTKNNRKLYWEIRDTLLHKMLIVKHETIETSGGIPIACSVKGIKGI